MRFDGAQAWVAIVAGMTAAMPAHAQTRAGTQIANTAQLLLTDGESTQRVIDSNTVTIAVAALVDAAIAAERPTVPVTATTPQPLAFVVSNPGNATTSYDVAAVADRADVRIVATVPDVDGNGRYDSTVDVPAPALTLAPGASQRVFVLVDGPSRDGATITATATAIPATDATLGSTTGRASASVRLLDAAEPAARLDKAQSVASPDGGARPVVGATVTYTLTARFVRDCAAVELDDAVPAGMAFVPGSITLDGRTLSDAADDDAGRLDGATVRVTLGDMPAGAVRSIRFKATIL